MGKRRGEKDEPDLELPSFFRRRNRRADSEPTDESVVPEPVEQAPTEAAQEPEAALEPEATRDQSVPAEPEPATDPEPQPTQQYDSFSDPTMPGMASADAAVHHPVEDAETPPDEPAAASYTDPGRRSARPRRTTPSLEPRFAAGLVGLLVGAAGTLLTWGALAGCEALRGTDSCGGPGLLVLVAILALMVVSGALLLKAVKVAEASATSFLGTGLMTVVVMVALLEAVFSRWMFVVVPLLTGASFVAAWWVSTRFVETEDEQPTVDVR